MAHEYERAELGRMLARMDAELELEYVYDEWSDRAKKRGVLLDYLGGKLRDLQKYLGGPIQEPDE